MKQMWQCAVKCIILGYNSVVCDKSKAINHPWWGPPGVLGIWWEWWFIFRELRSNGNYFRGSREQAHIFGDLGSHAKKQKSKGKASIIVWFFKKFFCFWGASPLDPPLKWCFHSFSDLHAYLDLSKRKLCQISICSFIMFKSLGR